MLRTARSGQGMDNSLLTVCSTPISPTLVCMYVFGSSSFFLTCSEMYIKFIIAPLNNNKKRKINICPFLSAQFMASIEFALYIAPLSN
jgi:hypothetical protein